MSLFRHQEIYRSDVGRRDERIAAPYHRCDEFPAGYSLAGCSPAEPASASPANPSLGGPVSCDNCSAANGDVSLISLSHFGAPPQPSKSGKIGDRPRFCIGFVSALYCETIAKPRTVPDFTIHAKRRWLRGNTLDLPVCAPIRFWYATAPSNSAKIIESCPKISTSSPVVIYACQPIACAGPPSRRRKKPSLRLSRNWAAQSSAATSTTPKNNTDSSTVRNAAWKSFARFPPAHPSLWWRLSGNTATTSSTVSTLITDPS